MNRTLRELSADERRVFSLITLRRCQILRELADGRTEKEAAARVGISLAGVRSHVNDLKDITSADTVRELGRWWRAHRHSWLEFLAEQAGAREQDAQPDEDS